MIDILLNNENNALLQPYTQQLAADSLLSFHLTVSAIKIFVNLLAMHRLPDTINYKLGNFVLLWKINCPLLANCIFASSCGGKTSLDLNVFCCGVPLHSLVQIQHKQ